MSKDLPINERIRSREVRVIDDQGAQIGVLSINDALRMARERNLDLVEVAPNAVPPVCRLLDYGRFKYEQTKKENEARKHQKLTLLKEVRMTPRTDDHDIDFKTRTIQRFLDDGDKVKVTIRFKGREMAHPQIGRQVLETIINNLKGVAAVERVPLLEGRSMTMILARADGASKAEKAAKEAKETAPQSPAPDSQ
ncbi:MAG: translation initiation factor IF-3 [Chloroflexota bacterium]